MSDDASPRPVQGDVSCFWTEDSEGYWNTVCGQAFVFTDGSPSDNGFKFCYHCGKPLEVAEEEMDDATRLARRDS